ncbi:MAG TPA: fibrobacter succinogenes major paralogous domain-containing protein [Panacibacter sp.]|nr:fibrobacter succinogenes major paralogous domain-containing protein [Panacibacter sp.]
MKQTIKTGLAALVLLLAISCKKENSTIQTSSFDGSSSAQNGIIDDKVLAGNTVTIGTQVWMNSNLKTKFYRNGDSIPQVTNRKAWKALTKGAWCWYNNDSARYAQTYGKLYNWYAVNDPRGLAPAGWHVPSLAEWYALSAFLGGDLVAGGKMKSTGTIEAGTGLWSAPNTDATNSSGFTGLPGGLRFYDGTFGDIGGEGIWWSSSPWGTPYAQEAILNYSWGLLTIYYKNPVREGHSIRCVKD